MDSIHFELGKGCEELRLIWLYDHYIGYLEALKSLKINANGLIYCSSLIVMMCTCAKLISDTHTNHFIYSHRIYIIFVFLILYFENHVLR